MQKKYYQASALDFTQSTNMELIDYLKQEPKARERKNKNRAIANVIYEKYSLDEKMFNELDKTTRADMVGEILSLDRKWRKILEENPDLRGSDYSDKTELEIEKQRELGYNV